MSRKLTIGLFGFGVVGEGIYNVLQQTPSLNTVIKKICIKHADKKRKAPAELFTTDKEEILCDDDINLVVELIDDAEAAYSIVCSALSNKKAVVSANKKMIAENLDQLLELQQKHDIPFLYEAAVCGSIPVIRNLEEYFDNDLLQGICGIVNGSTNYILTKILEEKMDYKKALAEAQCHGYAESDPSLDVQGIDAVNKLTILLLHGYGIVSKPQDHLHAGIDRIDPFDAGWATEKGLQIRLTAQSIKLKKDGKVAAFVLPQFVNAESQLFNVRNEFNGVVLESAFADKQFFYGKGAGMYPTASAVLSDISALRYNYRYEYRKRSNLAPGETTSDFYLRLYVSFDNWSDIDRNDFAWVEEFRAHDERQYLVGVIHFVKLKSSEWVHRKGVSIIVCPDGIIECIGTKKVKEKVLELAGSKRVDKMAEALALTD